MNTAENIEKLIKAFFKTKQSSAAVSSGMDEKVLDDALAAFEKSKMTQSADLQPSVWGIIIKSRITKLAVAAVIVFAAVLGINILNKSVPAAFGIEQVIDAYNNIRFLHVKQFDAGQKEPDEFWIKSDEQGRVEKARYYLPETEDGIKLITWTPERTELWFKSKHGLLIHQTKQIEGWMQSIMELCQPKLVMKKLLEDQKAGKVDIDIQKPQDKQKPIVIVTTYKAKPKKEIYYIDQATDLITHIEFYRIKNNQESLKGTMEFYDYNIPIDEEMFSLKDEVPEDVRIFDQRNKLIGVPQGNMTDEQIAVETIRQFFQALIDKDYKKAALIWGSGGGLEEYAKEDFGKFNFTAIVSFGSPMPYPQGGPQTFRVPCELEITKSDGQKTTCILAPYVRPGNDEMHPDRWNVNGGVDIDAFTKIEILPDNEKYEKMGPKETVIAFFNACNREDWNEVYKFIPMAAELSAEMKKETENYLGGLQIINIGEPFKASIYPGWFVPYEIRLKSGEIQKYDISVRNDNNARRYIYDGGF